MFDARWVDPRSPVRSPGVQRATAGGGRPPAVPARAERCGSVATRSVGVPALAVVRSYYFHFNSSGGSQTLISSIQHQLHVYPGTFARMIA